MLGVLPEGFGAGAQGRWWRQVAESLMATQAQAVSGKAVDRGGVHGTFGADDVGGPGGNGQLLRLQQAAGHGPAAGLFAAGAARRLS